MDSAAVVAWWCQTFPAVVAIANMSASDNTNSISRVFLFPEIFIQELRTSNYRSHDPPIVGQTCRSGNRLQHNAEGE